MATNKIGLRDYPDPPDYKVPCCPICGEQCEIIYKDKWGNICGCDDCIDALDAWEVLGDG